MIGSADVRPSLQPEQQEEKPKTLIQESWINHSCSVHVLCPCLRRRRSGQIRKRYPSPLVVVVIVAVAGGLEAVPPTTGRYPNPKPFIRAMVIDKGSGDLAT